MNEIDDLVESNINLLNNNQVLILNLNKSTEKVQIMDVNEIKNKEINKNLKTMCDYGIKPVMVVEGQNVSVYSPVIPDSS